MHHEDYPKLLLNAPMARIQLHFISHHMQMEKNAEKTTHLHRVNKTTIPDHLDCEEMSRITGN
jgi:hypothetical protein